MLSREKEVHALFDRYYESLCKRSFAITGSMNDAEEVVQDVFISLWKSKTSINEIGSPFYYLQAAVRNKSISFLQSNYARQKKSKMQELETIELSCTQEDKLSHNEAKTVIKQALSTLPPKCKEIFLLSRDAELPNKAIAEELNISVKTVENQITIALKKIHLFLEKHWY